MTANGALEIARAAAARHLRNSGFKEEADMVASGRGDDFVEVRIALSLHSIMSLAATAPTKSRLGHRLVGEEC